MAEVKDMKPLLEPTRTNADAVVAVNFCDTLAANQRRRNLETLLWLGMEIDGPSTDGEANRNRPLQFCSCCNDRRK